MKVKNLEGYWYYKEQKIKTKGYNGNYEPNNCRWATYTEQNNNQSTSRRYLYKDKEYTLKELSELSGIKLATLEQRINRSNWKVKKAVETKVQIKNTTVE